MQKTRAQPETQRFTARPFTPSQARKVQGVVASVPSRGICLATRKKRYGAELKKFNDNSQQAYQERKTRPIQLKFGYYEVPDRD